MKSDGGFVYSARTYEMLWQPGTGNNVGFNVFLGANTWGAIGAPAPAGRWVHVAGTYSSTDSVMRIYTNGVLVGETAHDASGTILLNHQLLRQTTLPLAFGAELTHPLGFTAGCMDEVRIGTKARSAQEIQATMFCRLTGTETNLAGYWTFDNGTANDLTGHGHNGTFAGGAQAVPIVGSDVVHAGVCGAATPCHTAKASAVLASDFVVGANMIDGGYCYTNMPTVRIIGGGGTGAGAGAVVSNGVVVAVNAMDAGYGYTNTPLVVIDPPFIPNPVLGIAPMSFLTFSNLTVGGVYQLQRSVGWYWIGPTSRSASRPPMLPIQKWSREWRATEITAWRSIRCQPRRSPRPLFIMGLLSAQQ
jgi:hypothetical protein